MKKVLFGFLSLFIVSFFAALLLPIVVDVNKYRPFIEEKVNEQIHGKLTVGKMSLSLWGHIKFGIDGLKLVDAHGTSIVEVRDAGIYLPFPNLLVGSPVLKVVLHQPMIQVVKGKDGKLNLVKLVKSGSQSSAGDKSYAPVTTSHSNSESNASVPAIVMRSKVTFLLDHAKVDYKDEVTGSNYDFKDLSFHLRDVSPTSKIPFDGDANLDLAISPTMSIKGQLKLEGDVKSAGPSGSPFDLLNGKLAVIFDDLDINSTGSFHKAKGVPLRIDTNFAFSPEGIDVPVLSFRIADVAIAGRASTKNRDTSTIVDGEIRSNKIDLSKLGNLLPSVSQSGLSGMIEVAAKVSGPSDRVSYDARAQLTGVNVKTDSLKSHVSINGSIEVTTNELKNLNLKFVSEGLDGALTGTLQNFTRPNVRMSFQAKELDLDRFMVKSATAPEDKGATHSAAESSGSHSSANNVQADANAILNPLKQNPILAQASGMFDFNIDHLKSSGVSIRSLKGQLVLNSLALQLKNMTFRMFDGAFKTDASINARAASPEIGMNLDINGLDTQKMAESQMSFAKNAVKGIVSGHFNLGGHGLNRTEINSQWHGGGQFSIRDASFSSLDIGKQIKSGLVEKLPAFVRSKINISDNLGNWKGDYQLLDAKFALQNGMLNLNELNGKAVPQKGMDLKGSGHLSIVDYAMEMNADFIDKYSLLGNDVPKDRRYGAAALSAKVTGTLMSPKYDWAHTIEQFAKNSATETVKEKGKDIIKQQLQNGAVPEGAKNLLKGLFH